MLAHSINPKFIDNTGAMSKMQNQVKILKVFYNTSPDFSNLQDTMVRILVQSEK